MSKCSQCDKLMRLEHGHELESCDVTHEVGGRECVERQLAQAREREATEKARCEQAEFRLAVLRKILEYVHFVLTDGGFVDGDLGNSVQLAADRIKTRADTVEAEVKRLREIVDRLPKTADGMPVMQGDTLFGVSEIDGRIIRLTADEPTLWAAIEDLPDEGVSDERIWDFCANAYSTREAAEGAKEKA